MFTIETERLYLKVFHPNDLEEFQRTIYSDADVTRYLPGGVPRPIERTEQSLLSLIEQQNAHGYSMWAITDKATGEFIGHGGLLRRPDTGNVELAYAFGKDYWGKGYATELADASLRYGFEHIGLSLIAAVAIPENVPSQRVMQKVGMTHRGMTRTYGDYDLVLYEIKLEEWQPSEAYYRLTL